MFKFYNFILLLFILYSCSPINKQHGYLLDDFLVSSEKISKFEVKNTTKNDVFNAMGSPSIEIQDVENVWIYLLSLKERKVFDEDELLFQSIYRFEFDNSGILIEQTFLTADNFNKIAFSSDETRVERNAYGITDQLYDAFTRGQ
jgi:outer membrane protein assembly factor BamE (lipoprotein component of BamABCDE complex)|tara:strand:+ start:106 stop:540 length:435 start_codon:yes stop_codon:yes gene_type:complete